MSKDFEPVFRVENPNRVGMFNALPDKLSTCPYFSMYDEDHVLPEDDNTLVSSLLKIGKYSPYGYIFGVERIHMLERWVQSEEVLRWLDEKNFTIGVYFPKHIVRGSTQCVFLPHGEFSFERQSLSLIDIGMEYNWFNMREKSTNENI